MHIFIPVAVIFLDLLFQSLKTVLLYCIGISRALSLRAVFINLGRVIANDKNGEPQLVGSGQAWLSETGPRSPSPVPALHLLPPGRLTVPLQSGPGHPGVNQF